MVRRLKPMSAGLAAPGIRAGGAADCLALGESLDLSMPQLTQLENWVKSRNLNAVSELSSPGERYKWQEGGCLLL